MRRHLTSALAFFALSLTGVSQSVQAAAEPGQPAPDFRLTDLSGQQVSLTGLRGRWVILEWTNPECPFVQKHYNSGNMQSTQQQAAAAKVVWVQINSTTPNHSDYRTPEQMRAWNASVKSVHAHAALDPEGRVGKAYGARTTPQMVLIQPDGKVAYHGAIDSIRSASAADIPKATNYVKQAMTEALAGKPVSVASSTPYGCSVKY
jgi:peroxiredoxin